MSPGLEDPAQEVYPGLLSLQLPEFRIHFPEPQFVHLICGMSGFAEQCLINLDPRPLPSNASPTGYSFRQMALVASNTGSLLSSNNFIFILFVCV